MHHLMRCAFVFAVLALIVGGARAQTVGPFGAVPSPKGELKIPEQVRSLLPAAAKVQVWEPTKLTTQGESFLLYELGTDDPLSGHSVALFVRDAKVLQEIELVDGCYFSKSAIFHLKPSLQSIAITFRCGGDGAASQFVFLGAPRGNTYEKILDLAIPEGRIRIHEATPVLLEVWSARSDLDSKNFEQSCIWCEHHYEIRTYELRDERFQPRQKSEITDDTFDPGEFLARPIEVLRPGQN